MIVKQLGIRSLASMRKERNHETGKTRMHKWFSGQYLRMVTVEKEPLRDGACSLQMMLVFVILKLTTHG